MSAQPMSKADRDNLASIVKMRVRVAKAQVAEREAELLADAEAQLAAIYKSTDDAWADVTALADKSIADADAAIAERCKTLGIPSEFRPGLHLSWYGRGDNGSKERRAELRKVAQTRIAADGRKAKLAIEQRSVEALTALAVNGLESDEARAFVELIPTAGQLMPPVDVAALKALSA